MCRLYKSPWLFPSHHIQQVAWAMWWCQQMATEEKVAEVHRILSVERAMKEVSLEGRL